MDDRIVQLLLSAIGGIIGAAVGYWFWVRQQLREIRRSYDQELRTARMKAYATLWQEFEPLAVYAPDQSITYRRILDLGIALRKWYFDTGGLLFTERARDAYFLVQDAIDRVAELPANDDVIRPVSRHWTRSTLKAEHKPLRLRELPAEGANDRDHTTWHDGTADRIAEWKFGEAPDKDFVLLQFLASSLRTLLARDLLARRPSMLQPA